MVVGGRAAGGVHSGKRLGHRLSEDYPETDILGASAVPHQLQAALDFLAEVQYHIVSLGEDGPFRFYIINLASKGLQQMAGIVNVTPGAYHAHRGKILRHKGGIGRFHSARGLLHASAEQHQSDREKEESHNQRLINCPVGVCNGRKTHIELNINHLRFTAFK